MFLRLQQRHVRDVREEWQTSELCEHLDPEEWQVQTEEEEGGGGKEGGGWTRSIWWVKYFPLKYFCVCLKQSAPLWWVQLLAGQLEHKSRILTVISFCLSPAESGIIVSLMVFKILTFLTTNSPLSSDIHQFCLNYPPNLDWRYLLWSPSLCLEYR